MDWGVLANQRIVTLILLFSSAAAHDYDELDINVLLDGSREDSFTSSTYASYASTYFTAQPSSGVDSD